MDVSTGDYRANVQKGAAGVVPMLREAIDALRYWLHDLHLCSADCSATLQLNFVKLPRGAPQVVGGER
jgi:hypothetical protein